MFMEFFLFLSGISVKSLISSYFSITLSQLIVESHPRGRIMPSHLKELT